MVVFYDFYRSIFGSLFQINHLIQMFLLLSLTLFWLQVDFYVRLLCPQWFISVYDGELYMH